MRTVRALMLFFVFAVLSTALAPRAGAVPSFASRYGGSCKGCHQPFPRLTERGEAFASNGFRRHGETAPTDTIGTRDELLVLGRTFPLSMRFESNVTWQGGDAYAPVTDFQTPFALKVLSSAPLSHDLSYYFYFFLFEHGEIGIEDAYVMWNDLGGKPFDVAVGQFQVSDPLFKRELRLMREDYAAYRARIGDARSDLTYDRGVLATWSPARWDFAFAAVNGVGRREAESGENFDTDAPKNVLARASLDAFEGVRVGGMAFAGWQDGSGPADEHVRAEVRMAGADFTLSHGDWQLNGQWLGRVDRQATFTPGEPEATTRGGFLEAIWAPAESRWYGFGLWNRLDCDRPLLNPRMGGPEDVTRYQSFAAGAGRLLQRSVRLQAEAGWDSEAERAKLAFTLVAAY